MRGRARGSPVLVQRAVSEDPRWTRAVGDSLSRPQGRRCNSGGRSMRAVRDSLLLSYEGEGARSSNDPSTFPWTFYLVRGAVLALWFVEPNKRDRPTRPDEPDPRHAPRNGV